MIAMAVAGPSLLARLSGGGGGGDGRCGLPAADAVARVRPLLHVACVAVAVADEAERKSLFSSGKIIWAKIE